MKAPRIAIMKTYSAPAGLIYRTKSGNEAGKISYGTLVSFGDTTILKGGDLYHVISWSNRVYLVGMFLQKSLCKLVDTPLPEPTPNKIPFVLTVQGFETFTGELTKK